jgi:hypothetical protein
MPRLAVGQDPVLTGPWPAAAATPPRPPPAAPAGRRVDDDPETLARVERLEAAWRFDVSEDETLVRGSTTSRSSSASRVAVVSWVGGRVVALHCNRCQGQWN